jgi:hypothetical protein
MSRSLSSGQVGRTMIELIIAMAIGLVIMVGIGALYHSSSGISRVASQSGSTQDLGRVAMFTIGEGVKAAGYGEWIGSEPSPFNQTMFFGPVIRGCSGSRFLAPNADPPDYTCAGVAPGDQLMVRYQSMHARMFAAGAMSDGIALPDCAGVSNTDQDTVIDAPGHVGNGLPVRIVRSVFNLNLTGTLLCEGNSNAGNPYHLIPNVIDFTVFYNFDRGGYNSVVGGGMGRYPAAGDSIMSAAEINLLPGPDPWNHVVGAIVCITIASAESGTNLRASDPNAPRCPRTPVEAALGPQTETATDGRLRRTFMQSFNLRTKGAPVGAITW